MPPALTLHVHNFDQSNECRIDGYQRRIDDCTSVESTVTSVESTVTSVESTLTSVESTIELASNKFC